MRKRLHECPDVISESNCRFQIDNAGDYEDCEHYVGECDFCGKGICSEIHKFKTVGGVDYHEDCEEA